MSNAERFARLFRGYTKRYGRFDLTSDAVPEQKRAGSAKTIDNELTFEEYKKHVEGSVGIGVIPLTDDNLVHFCSLDIDVYKLADQRTQNLTHEDIAVALADDPLLVTRSKSNGIHVWLFSEQGVVASIATRYLEGVAARLGVTGCEIFPKQTERVNEQDVGNWINLPYFGESRNAVIPDEEKGLVSLVEATLSQFLDVAENIAGSVTDEWLVEHTRLPPNQRDGLTNDLPLWMDGPPCMQTLLVGHPEKRDAIKKKLERGEITDEQFTKQMAFTNPQLAEGGRNEAFFNVGIYLRRRMFERDPDREPTEADRRALTEQLADANLEWARMSGEAGLKSSELSTIAKQAFKGKWGYACTKHPLKPFCNRRLCVKRKFGVGTSLQDVGLKINGFTVIDTEQKQYAFNVDGKRVYLPDVDTLLSQSAFGKAVTNATDRIWPTMHEPKYRELISNLLANADHIAGPRDVDTRSVLLSTLHEFVHSKKILKGQNDASIVSGRVVWVDELEAWFTMGEFVMFATNRGIQEPRRVIGRYLRDDFGIESRGNTTLGGMQIRPYVVNLAKLEMLITELGVDGDA